MTWENKATFKGSLLLPDPLGLQFFFEPESSGFWGGKRGGNSSLAGLGAEGGRCIPRM